LLFRHVLVLSILVQRFVDFGSETRVVCFFKVSDWCGVSVGRAYPLFGKLAGPAESFNFQRAAQQCELSQAGSTLEKLFQLGYLDVMYASASDAKDVVMRLDVAVIARNIVQERYLARLSHFAKLLENPMDCGQ
jgi:hypothetical protein